MISQYMINTWSIHLQLTTYLQHIFNRSFLMCSWHVFWKRDRVTCSATCAACATCSATRSRVEFFRSDFSSSTVDWRSSKVARPPAAPGPPHGSEQRRRSDGRAATTACPRRVHGVLQRSGTKCYEAWRTEKPRRSEQDFNVEFNVEFNNSTISKHMCLKMCLKMWSKCDQNVNSRDINRYQQISTDINRYQQISRVTKP